MRHRNESAPLILEQGGKRKKKKRVNVERDFDCHWAEIGLKLWAGEGDFPREGASRSQLEYGRLKHTEKGNPCASGGGETDFADMQVGQRL